MLFIPFRVDLELPRLPILTAVISIICIAIFIAQKQSFSESIKYADKFCQKKHEKIFFSSIKKITGDKNISSCINVILAIHFENNSTQKIDELIENIEPFSMLNKQQSQKRIKNSLSEKYNEFQSITPATLTSRLAYSPDNYDLMSMISSAFAHADWGHLIGNLIFFFAFAASIEMALGYILFPITVIMLAIGTNFAYSLTINPEHALPTLGLSGVVMGMIGLFTYLMPNAKIKCFFWFILVFRFLAIPAWILAVWYVGWDLYNLLDDKNQSNTNFIAHISGAVLGYLYGLIVFRKAKEQIQFQLLS